MISKLEMVAKAIYESDIPKGGKNYAAWDDLESLGYESARDVCIRHARAAIAAMRPATDAELVKALTSTPSIEDITPSNDDWNACETVQDRYDLMKRLIRAALAKHKGETL